MKRFTLSLALIFVCLISYQGSASGSSSSKADDVLGKMENVGRSLNSLMATLWQQKTNVQIGDEETAELGKIYYLPGKNGQMKLRIDIETPVPKTLIVNGDEVQFYQPKFREILVSSLKKASKDQSAGALAITFGSVNAIRANYNVNYVKDEKIDGEMTSLLHLTPKQPGPYKSVDIWISNTLWLPVQQRFVEINDDFTVMKLSKLEKNAKFDVNKLIDNFNPPNAKRRKV